MRAYIKDKKIENNDLQSSIKKYKDREREAKTKANIAFEVREGQFGEESNDLNYLDSGVMQQKLINIRKKQGLLIL